MTFIYPSVIKEENEEIKDIENLHKYTVVAVGDEIFVNEI